MKVQASDVGLEVARDKGGRQGGQTKGRWLLRPWERDCFYLLGRDLSSLLDRRWREREDRGERVEGEARP